MSFYKLNLYKPEYPFVGVDIEGINDMLGNKNKKLFNNLSVTQEIGFAASSIYTYEGWKIRITQSISFKSNLKEPTSHDLFLLFSFSVCGTPLCNAKNVSNSGSPHLESVNCFVDRQLDIPNSVPPDFSIFCLSVIPNTRNYATAFLWVKEKEESLIVNFTKTKEGVTAVVKYKF